MRTTGSRTAGQLPLEPFSHERPTALALLDLDRSWQPPVPAGTGGQAGADGQTPARDALLLVRLHGEPLDVLYVDRPLAEVGEGELRELVWPELAAALQAHVARCGCLPAPTCADDLAAWPGTATACPADDSAWPVGSIAIVVPTRGRHEGLRRCLASLSKLDGPPCEVIVVDNAPQAGHARLVVGDAAERSPHEIRYVAETRPGSSVARNRALAETAADIVAFTDDDIVVDCDWLRRLVAPFADPGVGAVTGLVLPLELATPAQKRFEQYAGFAKGFERRVYDLGANRADRLLYPFWGGLFGSGNSVAYRRRSLVAAGGYDPALGAGSRALAGADIEALSAVVLRGERLVYEPRSLCWHEHRRDDAALRRQVFNYGVGFTAILTKAALHDRRFAGAVARSLPLVLAMRRARREAAPGGVAAHGGPEIRRLERAGMLQGPARYLASVRWSRRLGLDRVIDGG